LFSHVGLFSKLRLEAKIRIKAFKRLEFMYFQVIFKLFPSKTMILMDQCINRSKR